jgi:hypothetical protein
MSKNTQEWLLTVCFFIVLAVAVMLANQRDTLKKEAIERGFAEYKVLGENQTEFVWKEKQ